MHQFRIAGIGGRQLIREPAREAYLTRTKLMDERSAAHVLQLPNTALHHQV